MYAVIRTGGKQYRVAPQDIIKIEKIAGEIGDQVAFSEVLMLGGEDGAPRIGTPLIAGATVTGEVVAQERAPKIIVFKKKRRKNYRRKKGHRQHLTVVRITEILADGKAPAKAKAKAKPAAKSKPKAEAEAGAKAPAKKKAETAKKAKPAGARAFSRLEAPEGEADDLKKITGVGPKLEKTLNELGIFHFWQIAAMSEDDIAEIDSALNFKGRITRDGWVEQARKLAAEG